MKTKFISPVAIILFALVITFFQISCKKSNSTTSTTTTPLTKDEILVQKTWRVDLVYQLISGSLTKYINGGTNTTGVTYDNTRFLFKAGGTGTYTNEFSTNYSLTWQFSTADKRTMIVSVNTPTVSNSTWEMVEIADNYMHLSVSFPVSGNSNNMETMRLKQVP